MTLADGEIVILERVHHHLKENDGEKPTTNNLKEDERVLEYYEPDSVSRILRKLADKEYLDKEKGRPNKYDVTEDGFQIVKRRNERKKKRLEKASAGDDITFDEAVNRFEDYFRTDDLEEKLAQAEADGGPMYIDYQHLEKFDTDLADALLVDPEEFLRAAEAAVDGVAVGEGIERVLLTNLPEYREKKIREISAADIGKLVTVPGIVLKASRMRPELVSATFECTSCGDRYEKEQSGGAPKSPYKCGCGNRKFDIVDKTFDDVRILKLQEKPDSPDKKDIKVRVRGSMANETVITEMKPGTAVKLAGVVKAEEPSRNGESHDWYIAALDVDSDQEKWEEIELTEEDRKRNQDIVEYGPVKAFQESLAMDKVVHRELMKEAFLLYLLGKTDDGNLHVLTMGVPGTGKTKLSNWAEEHMPKTVKASATGASVVGLTATVREDKDFGGYVAEGGSMTLADGGYHLLDELDKMDGEDLAHFNDALEDGTIPLDKGNVHTTLNADVSEWATANPREHDYFDPYKPKYQQIPIPPSSESTKDRFDVIIGVEEYSKDSQEKEDVVKHILRRGTGDAEETEPAFEPDELVKFVTEASRIDPVLTGDAEQKIMDVFFGLKDLEEQIDDDPVRLIANRGVLALKKLSIAYARANLSEEVTEQHAEMACDFFKRALESIDFEIGTDSFGDMGSKQKTDMREVRQAIEDLVEESDEDVAEFEDIVEETGMDDDRVEDLLKKGKREGEFYDPRSGMWRVT